MPAIRCLAPTDDAECLYQRGDYRLRRTMVEIKTYEEMHTRKSVKCKI